MNLIEYKKINEDNISLNLNEFEIIYKLSKDFNQPNISYRICYKILKDLNHPVSLTLLIKLTTSNVFNGISEILVNKNGEELSILESVILCVSFINLVVFKIENDIENLNKDIIEKFNKNQGYI
jgi:hypothetical protein